MYEFKLPQSVTISSCEELLSEIKEIKTNHEKIQLDSSEVDVVDTAGVQLICSLSNTIEQVTHVNISNAVKQAMSELGISYV